MFQQLLFWAGPSQLPGQQPMVQDCSANFPECACHIGAEVARVETAYSAPSCKLATVCTDFPNSSCDGLNKFNGIKLGHKRMQDER